MAYPTPTSPSPKPPVPAKGPPPRYNVAADEPTRFSIRTLVVITVSLMATAVSVYRIRDTFKQDTPQPSPFQEMLKANPEYAELVSAIRERDVEHARKVIAKYPWLVNFNRPETFGSPLMLAAVSNQPDLVDLLVDSGADVNAKVRWGATSLHWACWRGSADAVDALLHRGADVNARSDNDGSTPLFWASRGSREGFWSRNNHSAVIKILLDSGADPETSNRDGFYAVAVASDEIATLLTQHGATPRPAATQPTFGAATGESPRWGMGMGFRRFERDAANQPATTQSQ
jgi:hypothetical protein